MQGAFPKGKAPLLQMQHLRMLDYMISRGISYDVWIGIRPILPGAAESIHELYGPVLEVIAAIDHERWVRVRIKEGRSIGKLHNLDRKTDPNLVPFEELEPISQAKIRAEVRSMPFYLDKTGYELYQKS